MGRLAQTLGRRNTPQLCPYKHAHKGNRNSHATCCKDFQLSNEILAAFISVAGAVAGTLGGVWYGARLTREAARDLLAQQAKAEFASAFTDTLFKLTGPVPENRVGDAFNILQADYPRHLIAYISLRSVLPIKQQRTIDEAWQQYAKDDKNDLPEEREFYRFNHVLGPKSDEHQFMLATKHINVLLSKAAA